MSQAFRGSLGSHDTEIASRQHVLAVLASEHVVFLKCYHCGLSLLRNEHHFECCGKGTRMHPPWELPPPDLIELFCKPGFGAVSRIINTLFSTTILHSKDKGLWYHVGAAAPAMRLQGHLYAKMMRTASNFWFVADASYGQGYSSLCEREKQWVHIFHRILLRETRLFTVAADLSNMPRLSEINDVDIIISASETYLSAVYIGPGGAAPERCITQAAVAPTHGIVLGSRQALNEQSPFWEPLLYPLFNVRSEMRWRKRLTFPIISCASGKPMTLLAYLRSVMLYERYFWHSSRLAQQYLLDMWCRNEQTMVKFWMQPMFQQKLRHYMTIVQGRAVSEHKVFMPSSFPGTYRYSQRNYHDALFISSEGGNPHLFLTMTANPHWPEIRCLLPANQTASDRPDIIARVFSCKVMELIERLNTKGYLCPSHIGTQWLVYTIEWQQGGLPHVHLAVRLDIDETVTPMTTIHDQLRFMSSLISAKLPPPGSTAFHLVKTFMVHSNPCRHCVRKRRDGKEGCRFYFPKAPSTSTRVDNKGFPIYERGEGDTWVVPHILKLLEDFKCHINAEWTLSSQSIAYLYKYINKGVDSSGVRILEESLNEIAAFRKARVLSVSEVIWRVLRFDVNYKKPNVVLCVFRLPRDQSLESTRDSTENFMQQNRHDTAETLGTVPALDDDNNDIHDILDPTIDDNAGDNEYDISDISKDHLTRYFIREKDLHMCFTEYFSWWYAVQKRDLPRTSRSELSLNPNFFIDIAGTVWKRRVKPCLARMHWFSSTAGEIHYLRLLLLNIPASSYLDLKRGFNTFRESAIDAGLVHTDMESVYVLRDAIRLRFPGSTLRRLFCSLMFHSGGAYEAWKDATVRAALCHDYLASEARGETWSLATAESLTLMDLCVIANSMDKDDIHTKMNIYGLPDVPQSINDLLAISSTLPDGYALIHDFASIVGVNLRTRTLDRSFYTEINTFMARAEYTDEELQRRIGGLHREQVNIFTRLLHASSEILSSRSPRQRLFHIDAPAGCGKTFLCRTFAAYMQRQCHIVCCCATTGIAALQFFFGRTAHSLFQIPIELEKDVIFGDILQSKLLKRLQKAGYNSNRLQLLRNMHCLIWDEVSMVNKHVFNAVDRLLQVIMGNTLPFGGKMIVTLGDWRQIPPVCEENAARAINVDHVVYGASTYQISVLSLPLWSKFETLALTENIRAINYPHFHAALMRVGDGELLQIPTSEIQTLFPGVRVMYSLEDAITWLFLDEIAFPFEPNVSCFRACISPLNSEVRVTNDIVQSLLRKDPTVQMRDLLSIDTYNDVDISVDELPPIVQNIPTEDEDVTRLQAHLIETEMLYTTHADNHDDFYVEPVFADAAPLKNDDVTSDLLHSMDFPGVPAHKIVLCIGMIVLILRNLDPSNGIMNGTRMIVTDISLKGRLLTLRHPIVPSGTVQSFNPTTPFLLHRINFLCKVGKHGATMTRRQFPIRTAYGVTIHKSQSLTLDRVVIDLRSGVFDHGQLYVAMSRVRRAEDLCLLLRPEHEYIRNVVVELLLAHYK